MKRFGSLTPLGILVLLLAVAPAALAAGGGDGSCGEPLFVDPAGLDTDAMIEWAAAGGMAVASAASNPPPGTSCPPITSCGSCSEVFCVTTNTRTGSCVQPGGQIFTCPSGQSIRKVTCECSSFVQGEGGGCPSGASSYHCA